MQEKRSQSILFSDAVILLVKDSEHFIRKSPQLLKIQQYSWIKRTKIYTNIPMTKLTKKEPQGNIPIHSNLKVSSNKPNEMRDI